MSNDILEKGRRFPIGTIHNGFKKVAEGKWRKVSKKGLTKEQHEKKSEEYYRSPSSVGSDLGYEHSQYAKKLDSKEYSDTEVLGADKREEGSGKFRRTAEGWEPVKGDGKSSADIKKDIEDAPVGSKASGGGYSDWEKIGSNSWKNLKTGTLSHNEGLFSRIGGFDDFKVKPKATAKLDDKEYSDTEVMGEGNKKSMNYKGSGDEKKDNIQKALVTLELGHLIGDVDRKTIISARIEADTLSKGRKANIGEIREWKGGKFRKTSDGWEPVKKESGDGFVKHGDDLIMTHGQDKLIIYPTGDKFVLQINGENKMKGTLSTVKGAANDFIKDKSTKKESGDGFDKLEQDYNEKKNELNLLRQDKWEPGFSNNFSKNYGDSNFVKTMVIRPEIDFRKKESFFTVDCGYSKLPESGEEADKYYTSLNELKEKRFSHAREAAKAADEFASKWNTDNSPTNHIK